MLSSLKFLVWAGASVIVLRCIVRCGDAEAVSKCEDLGLAMCSGCEGENKTACESMVMDVFDCKNAVDVSDDYAACINELESQTECTSATLPDTCHGAILVSE